MRSIFQITFLLICTGVLSAQPLNYRITLEKTNAGGRAKLEVDLQFYPSRTDTSRFTLPSTINWSTGLHNCFRNFKAEGGRYVRQDSATVWVISRGAGPVTLHYEVVQPFNGEQVTLETSCSPILLRNYMHVPGECLFLTPWHYRDFEVSVSWSGLPRDWTIQNSFSTGQTEQHFHTTTLDWLRSNWVAGDFRILRGEALGKPIAFAIRGSWAFDDRTLFDIVEKTIETQRQTWDDRNIPFYSVTMIPFVLPTGGHVVGNARTGRCLGYGGYQSFVVYAADDCPLHPLIQLFNHEMSHDWIGGKINTGSPDSSASLRWLTEGFTDYYGLRDRWKAGFLDAAGFFKELNRDFLAAHYADPYGETPNLNLERNYFSTELFENLPYRRGCILAFYLDCAIRQKTDNRESLHNFMIDLMDYTYGKHRDLLENFDFLSETLAEYLNEQDAETFLNEYVDRGKRIPPAAFRMPDYLELRDVQGVPQVSPKAGMEREFLK